MRNEITKEQRYNIIRYFKQGLQLQEICNMTYVSISGLKRMLHECYKNGELTPRRSDLFGHEVPEIMAHSVHHKYIPTGIGKGGRNHERKKFTPEQEQEIIKDYFDNDLSRYELKDKWGINHQTMQDLFSRVIASGERQPKPKGRKWYKEKKDVDNKE